MPFEEHAQNGVRRRAVPDTLGGARRTLCAFEVFEAPANSILSSVTGYIAQAGFTHSLTPARNCTFACSYCYVPTMRIYGGLKPGDWQHWGQYTTFKSNAAELLGKQLRSEQRIYCSPLVDPYQPAEEDQRLMPRVLDAVIRNPPRVFSIQTRGPLILRDLDLLLALARRTTLRVSFSVTTNRESVRKLYEPHCAPIEQRLATIRHLREAGICTFATIAPMLPCDPEELAALVLEASNQNIISDALHVRAVKPRGATTREAALRISERHEFSAWLDPDFQREVAERIRTVVTKAGRRFATGPEAFRWLAQ
ncbi:MAG TPA: radical SAM protein [Bryobacteraceae bacterium]|nr:radical SAM protein [Bryobacteraceae bacterium]